MADIPIFQSGRGNATVEAALAVQRQAELAYRSGVLQALREVADSLVATTQVRDLIARTTSARTLPRRHCGSSACAIARASSATSRCWTRNASLFAAQIDLARSRLTQLLSYVDLYRALGGGWSDEDLAKLMKD